MGLSPYRRLKSLPMQSSSNFNQPKRRSVNLKNRLVQLGLMSVLFLLVAGCSKDGQSTWEAFGPVAQKQLDLFNVLLWVMVAVFIIVEGVLVYAIVRYRRRPGDAKPPQIHGNTSLEIILTIIPTILVLALGIWSVFTLFAIDKAPELSLIHI